MKKTIKKMQSKRKIDVTCQLITCMSDDAEIAINRAKQTLHFISQLEKFIENFWQKMV